MPKDHPHIILLMADQLRLDCLSAYGDLPVKTPHLDALSQESVVFDRAYCSSPLCVPTRTSMYTAKWPHQNGVIVNGNGLVNELPYAILAADQRTLYEQFDDAGYEITHVGVQHLRADPTLEARVPNAHIESFAAWEEYGQAHGIDTDIDGMVAEHIRPCPNYDHGQPVVMHFPTPKAIAPFPHPAEDFLDMFWASRTEALIEQLDTSKPQFIQTLFWAPHPPFVVPEPYFSMYPPAEIPLPETVAKWCDGQPGSLLIQTPGFLGAGLSREEYRATWSAYFGLVTLVDACLGRVIAALKKKGIWEDSLVIFMQDHGEMLGSHALMQKHCHYEEAAHVPLMVKPPGGELVGRRTQLASHIDLADTLCDYANIPRLPESEGRSLRPVVADPDTDWRSAVFMEYNGDWGRSTPTRAIVADTQAGNFKYIYNFGDKDELYDLDADPRETSSLIGSVDHQGMRFDLRARLAAWMRETDDYLAIDD